jgi:hypothetical protein
MAKQEMEKNIENLPKEMQQNPTLFSEMVSGDLAYHSHVIDCVYKCGHFLPELVNTIA